MVFQSEFTGTAEGKILKQFFEQELSKELLDILDDYRTHNDYLKLKNDLISHVSVLMRQTHLLRPKKEMHQNIGSVVMSFAEAGRLSQSDARILGGMLSDEHW